MALNKARIALCVGSLSSVLPRSVELSSFFDLCAGLFCWICSVWIRRGSRDVLELWTMKSVKVAGGIKGESAVFRIKSEAVSLEQTGNGNGSHEESYPSSKVETITSGTTAI